MKVRSSCICNDDDREDDVFEDGRGRGDTKAVAPVTTSAAAVAYMRG